MLTRRRLLHPTTCPPSLLRFFATSTVSREFPRSPALGDITHDGADVFNAKQKEFRDGLEAARKRKEQADSQSLAPSEPPYSPRHTSAHGCDFTPTAKATSTASSAAASVLDSLGLGSLSPARNTGEARLAEESSGRRKGPFSNLIYGTPEGRSMDKEMERSFSQVLARGKYVHSIVFHDVRPDKVDEYVQLVGSWYPRMAGMEENKVNLVGSWRTEVGDCDTFGQQSSNLSPVTFNG